MAREFSDFTNRVAVVTGGGGVLCSVLAQALAARGAKVAVLDLKQEAAERTASAIRQAGGTALGIAANVLEKDSLEAAAKQVYDAFGTCDVLINGAGGNHPKGTTDKETLRPEDLDKAAEECKTFFDLDPAGISFVFQLNFLGTLLPTQVFARRMAQSGKGGCIINISSMNAFRPLTKIPAYSAAKAAVSNFTAWLAVHFAPVNIRVNAIAPGFFLTAQNKTLLTKEDGSLTPRGEKILTHTPMGRFGVPEDLEGAVLFLADEGLAGFVNGVVLPIDGAFAAFSGI